MTVSKRSWRRRGAFIAAATSVIGLGLCAVPAQAHAPAWSVSCSEVTVDLKAYNAKVTNTVTVSVDGKDILPTQEFGSSFSKTLPLAEHTEKLSVHLVVKAGDSQQFSLDETKTAPVCDTPKPPVTPTPSDTPSKPAPTPSESVTPSASPSESAAVPVPSPSASKPTDLAETGSSSSTPLIAGAAAVVIVAGGGIMFAARKRRSTQS